MASYYYKNKHIDTKSDSSYDEEKERIKKEKAMEKFRVPLHINKEYQKHKKALCSLRSLSDLQFDWDIAFCNFFTHKLVSNR